MHTPYTLVSSTSVDQQPTVLEVLRTRIEQHFPWFVVLGIVGDTNPLLAVKDTSNCDLCVGFRCEADLAAYLTCIGKGRTAHE
jgi:hypothetical protein